MNRPAYDYAQAHDFFETCTRHVLAAEREAGVQHHVGVSMIGAASIETEFFRGKAAQERLVAASTTPHSVLRTTLSYELVPRIVEHAATTYLVRLPPVRVQPVAADHIVAELVRLALGEPRNGTFELAGPTVRFLDDLARQVPAAYYLGARLDPGTEVLLPAWRETTATFHDWQSAHHRRPAGAISPT
ncbi:hypothetical protein [Nocardioides sp. YIM 152315]|uniref:SDR family oxidoreductase n=1 Tax=Nocardioides sp. YIM 152315 TaxID=3031760 RepID=UPI0023D98976|nr:hypothetical protein [Nocardioides sp. YIM 152315]MDF1602034.1 hypothetical protein [Nocardioides sp. YIM 152315]